MTNETYNALQPEDFPMVVKYTGLFYKNMEFIAEHKGDFSPYGYHHIEIVKKNNRLKIFGKPANV